MKSGMKCLIESFYSSILEDTAPPIPYREILLTARIMDAIFVQLDANRKDDQVQERIVAYSTTRSAEELKAY
jgi:hypothetical protein